MALVALDPFARTCARNSAVFAAAISLASLILGVLLGWLVTRCRFWGRPLLRPAVGALLLVPPAFLALGLLGLFGPPGVWPWERTRAGAEIRAASLESWRGVPLWLVWSWTTLPAAVSLVTLAVASAVTQIEPSAGDAARLAGARPLAAWQALLWPIVRPRAARAAGIVFVLALLEPGAPLVLGLRRTLAYQIVENARRPEPFPAAAAWCVLAGLIGFAGWILFRWWGGTVVSANRALPSAGGAGRHGARPASPAVAFGACVLLGGWACFGWLPQLGLVRVALNAAHPGIISESDPSNVLRALARRLADPPFAALLTSSAMLGLEAAACIMLLGWMLRAGAGAGGGAGVRRTSRRLARAATLAPPLISGVGILTLPWLADLVAGPPEGAQRSALLSPVFAALSAALDPYRNPWPLLVTGVVLVLTPSLLSAWEEGARPAAVRAHSAVDAARLYGATWFGRLRLLTEHPVRRWAGRFILAWALAATNLAPALLFGPWADSVAVAPAVVALADGPGDARSTAAILALGASALLIAALGAARATGAIKDLREH
jgi:ABC-type Fe3+ transport system permease subunit